MWTSIVAGRCDSDGTRGGLRGAYEKECKTAGLRRRRTDEGEGMMGGWFADRNGELSEAECIAKIAVGYEVWG